MNSFVPYQTYATYDGHITYCDWGNLKDAPTFIIQPNICTKFEFFGAQAIAGKELNDLFLNLLKQAK